MILKKLSLLNYKNFESKAFEFNDKINCFVGRNGVGKTNVLDAIYHLSLGKSYFNPIAVQNIKHGQDFFMIEGKYLKEVEKESDEKVVVSLKRGQKKTIKKNGKAYEKLLDHIGCFPLVIISPSDNDLINDGSDVRRKFVDTSIAQNDNAYLVDLIRYNKILAQRNSLLKYFALNNNFNRDALSVYDIQMDNLAQRIFEKRDKFLKDFIPTFLSRHKGVSAENETVSLEYKSDLFNGKQSKLMEASLFKDRALQYTSVGIHKDDLLFKIEDYPIKKNGSQGQQKTFLIALKFAQFDFTKKQSGINPILLLDDIFDKLDEQRVEQIVQIVGSHDFGQVFISDTHAERTESIIKRIHKSYEIIAL